MSGNPPKKPPNPAPAPVVMTVTRPTVIGAPVKTPTQLKSNIPSVRQSRMIRSSKLVEELEILSNKNPQKKKKKRSHSTVSKNGLGSFVESIAENSSDHKINKQASHAGPTSALSGLTNKPLKTRNQENDYKDFSKIDFSNNEKINDGKKTVNLPRMSTIGGRAPTLIRHNDVDPARSLISDFASRSLLSLSTLGSKVRLSQTSYLSPIFWEGFFC